MRKSHAQHPTISLGNGLVEMFNQTLLQMLRTMEESKKSDWKTRVPSHVHAYNSTFHESTAIDAFFGLCPDLMYATKQTEYVRKLRQRLNFADEKATKRTGLLNKYKYDLKARSSVLQLGDHVLVRHIGLRGKHKLPGRWEHKPYIVREQPNHDTPVYIVQEEGSRKKTKDTPQKSALTIHHLANHLDRNFNRMDLPLV